jgi:DNA (cytosine-5)-methyltransferase 1
MSTFGSLFSGIGGLDLGLERAGWECRWQVETDPFCTAVLERHWPDVPRYGDVREVGDDLEPVDLICGGFPCQPVSVAGQRRGQADDRWLWPEFARIVRLVRPRFVLMENVPGLLARGMGDVLGDLAALGFDAEWDCLPAAAFGAPHLRYRVFLVAHANEGELRVQPAGLARSSGASVPTDDGSTWALADAEGISGQVRPAEGERRGRSSGGSDGLAHPDGKPVVWAAVARPERSPWATEPDVGRVAHGVPDRVDRLRALGNAVVPQVAEWIGRRLMEAS